MDIFGLTHTEADIIYPWYQSLIQRGEYPFFVLFLKMPIDNYDVNVHPAKLEVRFINEWQVYHIIKSSITNVLQNILNVIPDYKSNGITEPYIPIYTSELPFSGKSYSDLYSIDKPPHQKKYQGNDVHLSLDNNDRLDRAHTRIRLKVEDIPVNVNELQSVTEHIWQIHNKYLITEITSGLIIIDQHVAHDRILFEEAKNAMEGSGFPSQTILFPQTVKFLPEEIDELPLPAIIHYGGSHYVVAVRSTKNYVCILDPASGDYILPRPFMLRNISGYAVVLGAKQQKKSIPVSLLNKIKNNRLCWF